MYVTPLLGKSSMGIGVVVEVRGCGKKNILKFICKCRFIILSEILRYLYRGLKLNPYLYQGEHS